MTVLGCMSLLLDNNNAKQKHPECKNVRGQSEAALQTSATKNFDIS